MHGRQLQLKGSRSLATGALLVVSVLLAACSGGQNTGNGGARATSVSAPGRAATAAPARPAVSIGGERTPQEIVKKVTPSVVKVQTEASQQSVFGQVQQNGTGTGIVLDNQGHVLTNNHVVTLDSDRPASNITVVLSDGRNLSAKLVGRDQNTDLAVLQVDAKNLTPLSFAPANSIEVGEPVLAIGYALNLQGTPTVTSGVVSALDRTIPETIQSSGGATQVTISGAIQTDAPINPGNSGGPLVNLKGEVVGINTAGQNGTQGIFFAVSSSVAKPVVSDLIAKGKVVRGFLGITTESVSPDAANKQNLAVTQGVLVDSVQPGTPADKAGLKPGDIIVSIGSRDIRNTGDLQQALAENPPGSKVMVGYYHGKDKRSVELTLGTRPDNLG